MEQDNIQTIVDRFQFLLNMQLQAQLPRPGGFHIYSKGALLAGFHSVREVDNAGNVKWRLVISSGIDYGAYAMGFKDDGSKRTPRGPRERINFETIRICCEQVAKIVALPTNGKVDIDIR